MSGAESIARPVVRGSNSKTRLSLLGHFSIIIHNMATYNYLNRGVATAGYSAYHYCGRGGERVSVYVRMDVGMYGDVCMYVQNFCIAR